MCKRSKLDKQGNEDKHHREHQRRYQFTKTRLLLFVKSTKLDRHARRQLHVFRELLTDLTNGRTEIVSFKASGHRDHLAQILALDLRLTFIDLDLRNLIEPEELSRRRAHLQRFDRIERRAHVCRKDPPHFDQTILLQDRRTSIT